MMTAEVSATTLYEPEFDDDFNEPTDDFTDSFASPVDATPKSFADKALNRLANRERFKDSAAQRTASLVYASLEQAAATDRQTAVLERQLAAAERQNELTEILIADQRDQGLRSLTEQRMHSQLLFFSMTEADFRSNPTPVVTNEDGSPARDSLYAQMKRNLGISAPLPSAAPTAPSAPEPDDTDEGSDGY